MRQAERKELTHSKILEASVKIFAEKGFDSAKLDEIARVAGVAKGSIYNYYQSKDELYFSIIKQSFDELFASIDIEPELPFNFEDHFRGRLEKYYKFAQEHPNLFKMVFKGLARFDKEWSGQIRELFMKNIKRENAILENFLPQRKRSDEVVVVITSIVESVIFNWLIEGQDADLTDRVDLIHDLLLGGIYRLWEKEDRENAQMGMA